jgi:hypothetical protein
MYLLAASQEGRRHVPFNDVGYLVVGLLGVGLGTWFGMTKLGVWYSLYKLGQAESRDRRRRING